MVTQLKTESKNLYETDYNLWVLPEFEINLLVKMRRGDEGTRGRGD
jgi:hypothetical protein